MNKAFWLCIACSAGVYAVACSSSNGTSGTQGTSSGGGGHTTSATGGSTTSSTSSTATGTGGTTTSSTSATGTSSTSTSSASTSTTSSTTAACTGATPISLTVKNFDSWCDITVNGNAIPTVGSQVVCVAASSTVSLVASPAGSSFELGPAPWHDTSGDVDAGGDPGTLIDGGRDAAGDGVDTASVTVGASGTACIWACCPFTGGSGCPTTNQCP